jgi:hypothetical protein
LYLDVDCSSITYDTKPTYGILKAVNKTLKMIAENCQTEKISTNTDLEQDYSNLYDVEVTTDNPVCNITTDSDKNENVTNETISMSPNETLSNSLLSSIDPTNTTEAELKEAFCRDIDMFSWELSKPPPPPKRPKNGSPSSFGSMWTTFGHWMLFSYYLRK